MYIVVTKAIDPVGRASHAALSFVGESRADHYGLNLLTPPQRASIAKLQANRASGQHDHDLHHVLRDDLSGDTLLALHHAEEGVSHVRVHADGLLNRATPHEGHAVIHTFSGDSHGQGTAQTDPVSAARLAPGSDRAGQGGRSAGRALPNPNGFERQLHYDGAHKPVGTRVSGKIGIWDVDSVKQARGDWQNVAPGADRPETESSFERKRQQALHKSVLVITGDGRHLSRTLRKAMFSPALHPRAPKGGPTGQGALFLPGEFVPRFFSSAPASQPAPDLVRQVIADAEREFHPLRYEHGRAVSDSGEIVFDKSGGASHIRVSGGDLRRLQKARGVVFTHNHPQGWRFPVDDPRHEGSSFSLEDVNLACMAGLAEIRAITPTHRYSLRPGSEGWNEAYWHTVVWPMAQAQESAVRLDLQSAILRGQMTCEEAGATHYHALWSQVAHALGWEYAKMPLDGSLEKAVPDAAKRTHRLPDDTVLVLDASLDRVLYRPADSSAPGDEMAQRMAAQAYRSDTDEGLL